MKAKNTMPKKILGILFLSYIIDLISGESLNMIIPPQRMECFYVPKEKGHRFTFNIQAHSGEKSDFSLFSPENRPMEMQNPLHEFEYDDVAKHSGDYAFCFSNHYSYTRSSIVSLDYDAHLEEKEKSYSDFKEEKVEYLKYLLKIKPLQNTNNPPPLDPEKQSAKYKMLAIAVNLDRCSFYLNRLKSQMAHHHYLQETNSSFVTYSSLGLCFAIIVMGMVQVVVLKSLFVGRINLKVWEF